jgi:hypothetical protein
VKLNFSKREWSFSNSFFSTKDLPTLLWWSWRAFQAERESACTILAVVLLLFVGDVLGCGYDVQSGRRCMADVAFSAGTCVSGELSTRGG